MAEAIFNTKSSGGGHSAISAGVNPAPIVQPETLEVLTEADFNIDGLSPQLVTRELIDQADKVITMDHMITEALHNEATETWKIPDPYRMTINDYRKTRDILVEKVEELMKELEA
jgi:protein-tyrosine-phosphatase